MENSTRQSLASLNASKEALRADERAWLAAERIDAPEAQVIKGGNFNGTFTTGQDPIHVILHNTGKTPALNVSIESCKSAIRRREEPTPDFDTIENINPVPPDGRITYIPTEPAKTGWIVTPGGTHEIDAGAIRAKLWNFRERADGPVSSKGEHEHVLDSFVVYILGKVTYNDVFEGAKRHTTKFCFMYSKTDMPTGPQFFSSCPRGNWMD
jgi:hypothetical protein